MQSNQMLIKPSNSLQKGALLRILLMFFTSIASHRETVHDTTVKINLVWLLGLNEDRLGLVAFLGREDLVGFCGGDGEGAGNRCEFGFFDEAMCIWLILCYLRGERGRTKGEQGSRHRCPFLLQ